MSLQLVATEDERQEIATTRSNSLSSSCSPPDKGSSDTSSGIHSSSSVCDHHQSGRKSCSMDDLPKNINYYCPKPKSCWKSLSLQRTSSTSPFSSSGRGGAIAVYPKPGLDYVGYPPSIKDGRRDSTMVMLRNDKRPKTADLSQSRDPFGRDTNMRLTSFTDFTDPLSKCASSVVSSSITKQKIAPITIGILTSSPRHLPCTPDVVASRSTNSPHLPNLVPGVCKMANRQRDSANYSLTSSGESDNYLSHP